MVEVYVYDKKAAEDLAAQLRGVGLEAAVQDGLALSVSAADFWVVVGRLADLMTIGVPVGTAAWAFLKTEGGIRLRSVLRDVTGRKELHPAFSFDAVVAWFNREIGEPASTGQRSWRFDPDAIKGRQLTRGLVALEVYEEVSGKLLLLVTDGEQVQWLNDRVKSSRSP
jgi:hypothetical protein